MGASLTALLGYDVTDPRSPHSVHVATEADVPAVAPWGRAHLHAAVRLADDRDEVVVLDHGRGWLYLAPPERLHYRPPGAPGLGDPPALVVERPALLGPDGDERGLAPRAFDPTVLDDPPREWRVDDSGGSEADGPAPETGSQPSPGDDPVGSGDPDSDPDPVADGSGPRSGPDGDSDVAGHAGVDTDESDDPGDGSDAADTDESDDPTRRSPSVTVSPAFDVLVPAFDIEEQGEPAEPIERHAVESPTGVGTGTPSG